MNPDTRDGIVGVIPAAGFATRLAPLPSSKELLVVGRRGREGDERPKVVSHYLLENLRLAGVEKAFFVLRAGKWDIPAYYGDGSAFGIDLGYLVARVPFGPAYTIDSAYPFVRRSIVAVGFPDIVYDPPDAFAHVRDELERSRADVSLGLFPTALPHATDMVRLDDGWVREIELKPKQARFPFAWALAVWSPAFTEFLHEHLRVRPHGQDYPEVSVGHVLVAALEAGLSMRGVPFPEGGFIDVGTPEGLRDATRRFAP